MLQRNVTVAILDLDNTLWDWVEIWGRSFRAMLDKIVEISGIPEEDLYDPISRVHQRHHTSEYAFLIEELEILKERHPGENLIEVYAPAINAYREARREAMVLYPGVFETLWALRDRGTFVVAYTESQEYYTNYRVRRLGLDGLIDVIYSPADHELPEGLNPEQVRKYRADTYRLKRTRHRHTPPGELKPNPRVLMSILEEIGATPDEAIYVGDSEMKDVAMAQDCGVRDVHAAYGLAQHRDAYELLRKVTHWTKEDVERERRIQQRGEVKPTFVIDRGFEQLLGMFDFQRFKKPEADNIAHSIDAWKKIVDVQQHFNDLELRIRSFAITLLVAVIGGAGLVARDGLGIRIPATALIALAVAGVLTFLAVTSQPRTSKRRRLAGGAFVVSLLAVVLPASGWTGSRVWAPLALVILAGGACGWLAFWFMDRLWYHRLLMGSVRAGASLEDRLKEHVPGIELTNAIGQASPFHFRGRNIHSSEKMDWFYLSVLVLLVLLATATYLVESSDPAPTRHSVTVESWPPLPQDPEQSTSVDPTGSRPSEPPPPR